MGLLTKIFGNRDDPESTADEGPDENSIERETVELEPYQLSAADEPAATEQSGRVTIAPAEDDSTAPGISGGRRKRRRPSMAADNAAADNAAADNAAADNDEEQPHELTRRRRAGPSVSAVDPPANPPPIPADLSTADDPEEIDVSDQLDDVSDVVVDVDPSEDLIVEDDEPIRDEEDDNEEDEEVTSTSILWGAAADRHESIPPATIEPDPERASMATMMTPKQTLVEAGTSFTGTVKSTCPVVVSGTIEGEIDVPELSIASTGVVSGVVRAETLRSQGTLAGRVEAGEVYVSGTVRNKTVIRARLLELQLASSENSRLELRFGNAELGSSELEPKDLPSPASAALEA